MNTTTTIFFYTPDDLACHTKEQGLTLFYEAIEEDGETALLHLSCFWEGRYCYWQADTDVTSRAAVDKRLALLLKWLESTWDIYPVQAAVNLSGDTLTTDVAEYPDFLKPKKEKRT